MYWTAKSHWKFVFGFSEKVTPYNKVCAFSYHNTLWVVKLIDFAKYSLGMGFLWYLEKWKVPKTCEKTLMDDLFDQKQYPPSSRLKNLTSNKNIYLQL